jgi:hypothetical protein
MSTPIFVVYKYRQPVAAYLSEAHAQARASNRHVHANSWWPTQVAGQVTAGDEVHLPMIGCREQCPSKDKVGIWASKQEAHVAVADYVAQRCLADKPYHVQWNCLRVHQ